ncbi:MAG: ketopantoate reductase family protein [Oligoflexales bacterium]
MNKVAVVIGNGNIGSLVGVSMAEKFPGSIYFVGSKGLLSHDVPYIRFGKEGLTKFPLPPKLPIQADVIFLAVKAYQIPLVLRDFSIVVKDGAPIISLCNGYVREELDELKARFPKAVIRQGMATFGAKIPDDGIRRFTEKGGIFWGPFGDNAPATEIESTIVRDNQAFGFTFDMEVENRIRQKWLFNVAVNTLCGEKRLAKNRETLNHYPTLKQYFDEAYHCADGLWGPWAKPYEKSFEECLRLVDETGENENSMACDVRLGRKTESEYLAGVCARDAKAHPGLAQAHRKVSN